MGRTLHYSISKDSKFTLKELKAMDKIYTHYNSGKYKKVWTCESFDLAPYPHYPKWKRYDGKFISWEKFNPMWKALDKDKAFPMSNYDKLKHFVNTDYLEWGNGDPLKQTSIQGFTKTQGNEFNSLLVYRALLAVSLAVPKGVLTVRDEGEFLLCDLKIQNGKVLPVLSALKKDISKWATIYTLNLSRGLEKGTKEGFPDVLMSEFFDTTYASYAKKYLNEYVNKAKAVSNIIMENLPKPFERQDTRSIFHGNYVQLRMNTIETLEPKYWFKPELFCRYVETADFEDYENKTSMQKLMDGFHGEGFGIADPEDAEDDAIRRTAFLQKALCGNDIKLEILKEV